MALAVFSFDNLGAAAEVGDGSRTAPDPGHPSLTTGLPRLLDLLDATGIRSTFFVEGWNGVHHPEAVASIVERGHDLGTHGWTHEDWGELAPAEEADRLHQATEALERAAGVRPAGFRAPGGRRTPRTEGLLSTAGYTYDASLPPDGATPAPTPVRLPAGLPSVGFTWSGVDGFWYLRDEPAEPDAVAAAWIGALDRTVERDGCFVAVCHPFVTGTHPERTDALRSVIAHAVAHDRITVKTVAEAVGAPRVGLVAR